MTTDTINPSADAIAATCADAGIDQVPGCDQTCERCKELQAEIADWQENSYHGHIVKCPTCGSNLTSLLLCPKCGIRYELNQQDELADMTADRDGERRWAFQYKAERDALQAKCADYENAFKHMQDDITRAEDLAKGLQRRIDAMLRGIELARAIFTNPDDATDYNADVYAVLDAIKDAK